MVSNVRIGQNVKGSPGKLKMGAIQEKGPKSNAQIKIFRVCIEHSLIRVILLLLLIESFIQNY